MREALSNVFKPSGVKRMAYFWKGSATICILYQPHPRPYQHAFYRYLPIVGH